MISSISVPHMIHEAGFPEIQRANDAREAFAKQQGGKTWTEYSQDLRTQAVFIEAFKKTFSVSTSLKIADTTYSVYSRWRASSIWFAREFNSAIQEWADQILSSAAIRARGVLVKSDETESGYAEDATGAPIYYDANDRMTMAFLKALYPDSFGDKVSVDHSGGLNNTTTTLTVDEYKKAREEMLKDDDC